MNIGQDPALPIKSFECHVTVATKYADVAREVAAKLGWKTSQIDGAPVLGGAPFFYLTKHDAGIEAIHNAMHNAMHDAVQELFKRGVPVIREKIEAIVHDRRFQ